MQIWNPVASFTRPADTTQYSIGDLIANSTTAGSVVPLSWALGGNTQPGGTRITRARLVKSNISPTLSAFRLHLYQKTMTVANGDNGAWSSSGALDYLGFLAGPTVLQAFTDGCADAAPATAGAEIIARLGSGTTLFGLLEARAAYTPVSGEVFTVTLESLESY